MESETIFLKEALNIMKRRSVDGRLHPFDLLIRTFNSQTGQGGKLKEYKQVRLLPEANPNKKKEVNIHNVLDPVVSNKRPSHFKNRTRNIELEDGSVRSIRIDFIIKINNQTVIY